MQIGARNVNKLRSQPADQEGQVLGQDLAIRAAQEANEALEVNRLFGQVQRDLQQNASNFTSRASCSSTWMVTLSFLPTSSVPFSATHFFAPSSVLNSTR